MAKSLLEALGRLDSKVFTGYECEPELNLFFALFERLKINYISKHGEGVNIGHLNKCPYTATIRIDKNGSLVRSRETGCCCNYTQKEM